MSFVKGQYYRCIRNLSYADRFTVGQVYKCETPVSGGSGKFAGFISDLGAEVHLYADRFDPNPVVPMPGGAPSPQLTTNHIAAVQAQTLGAMALPSPPKAVVTAAGAVCRCGKQAEKKIFATFEYFFCPVCKKEVGGKAHETPAASTSPVLAHFQHSINSIHAQLANSYGMTGGPLPPGIAALKGEKVLCYSCGGQRATLAVDLPQYPNIFGRSWASVVSNVQVCCSKGDGLGPYRSDGFRYKIAGRGEV